MGKQPQRAKPPIPALQKNGWWIVFHPNFRRAIAGLTEDVEALEASDPSGAWQSNDKAKLLARIFKVVCEEVPSDPEHPKFEQGNTLGEDARGWRRAKFLSRFRLFFRFDKRKKIIVFCWVNDENTLRQAGGKNDPYRVFKKKLQDGDPPSDWASLIEACRAEIVDDPVQRAFGLPVALPGEDVGETSTPAPKKTPKRKR